MSDESPAENLKMRKINLLMEATLRLQSNEVTEMFGGAIRWYADPKVWKILAPKSDQQDYRPRVCPHGIDLDKLCEQCSADRVYTELVDD